MILMASDKEFIGEFVFQSGSNMNDLVHVLQDEGYITEVEFKDKKEYRITIYKRSNGSTTVSGDTYSVD
jgi:ribosomal protein S8